MLVPRVEAREKRLEGGSMTVPPLGVGLASSTCGGTYLGSAPRFFPSMPALTTIMVEPEEVVASPMLCSSLCCLVTRFDFFVEVYTDKCVIEKKNIITI